MKRYTVGVDFGTLSARAILLDAVSGETLATEVMEYPHGVMDSALPSGRRLPPQFALQHPDDYLTALTATVQNVMRRAGVTAEEVAGLGLDFTSCTLLPIQEDGTPLCKDPRYADEPHAYVKLWKHHGASKEAEDVTALAHRRGEKWLDIYGGKVSSEWAIPKILETLRQAPSVYRDAARFMEAGEWLSMLLTGKASYASGFAGMKCFWNDGNGFPTDDFFCALDPRLSGIVGTKLPTAEQIQPIDRRAGLLSKSGAALVGLTEGTPLSLSVLDAHAAMPALNITREGDMALILGTSGVQLLHHNKALCIRGICGYAKDCIVPGLYTYEAGLSAVGDLFDWFVKRCVPAEYTLLAQREGVGIHRYLRDRAKQLRVGESGLLALDWWNGNRSVLQKAELSGLIIGLTLQTRPEEIYRALIEATAFATKRIAEAFEDGGIPIGRIVASGGIAQKDGMMMQIYADVLGKEICVPKTAEGAARGSAILAAVAAGLYPSVVEASDALSVKDAVCYTPIAENCEAYAVLYREYCRLYDLFGADGEHSVMRLLRDLANGTK